MIVSYDNFFDNFEELKGCFKTVPLYTPEELIKNYNYDNQYWPGKRSRFLNDTEETKPLFFLFLNEFHHKLGNIFIGKKYELKLSIHLRLEEDEQKDWIHTDDDSADYSMVINLSDTNLKSGTSFFDNNDNEVLTSKFVQNRAIVFKSDIRHKALGNHGTNIDNGRLTMNGFFTVI